jgi:iron(II)-dependent oxidoreductase
MMFMNDTAVHRPTSGATADRLAVELSDTRARTRRLTEDLSTAQLMGPMLPIVNPILWEIGHVGWFHEYWTLRHVHGAAPLIAGADLLWNSSTVPHATRWDLSMPDRAAIFTFLADVMDRQRDRLSKGVETSAHYFYELAIRHEDMHVEALTYTRQTHGYAPPALGAASERDGGAWPGDAEVPGGRWALGSRAADGFVFDNEKWAHDVELAPFRIAKAPVTNTEYAAFVEDGGYTHREFWGDAGWAWRERTGADKPVYWRSRNGGAWTWRRYDRTEELPPHAPAVFINWYEANAWCRWAKRRLPTEAEWEAAAVGEPGDGGTRLAPAKRRWPWGSEAPVPGHANVDFASDQPIAVSSCPGGDGAFGCRQMVGNVWEWTASDFVPFRGFSPDPYEDYSQPWFNTRKVLRGGAWPTSERLARASYRNFFTPERNDVIAGFRTCAL